MASFNGTTRQAIDATYTQALTLSTPTDSLGLEWSQTWASGTGNNQANLVFTKSLSLVATTDSLDLNGGGLKDAFGNTLVFAKVKELWIRNKSTVAGEVLLVSGNFVETALLSGVSADTPKLNLDPGGALRWPSPIDGFTVAAGTGDTILMDSGTKTFTYEIVIIGTE